jgi:hypothetical protein
VDERPIVKAASIKFVATFRAQFGKEELGGERASSGRETQATRVVLSSRLIVVCARSSQVGRHAPVPRTLTRAAPPLTFLPTTSAALLPLLAPFVSARHYVVHTYAAAAVERLLLVKDKAPADPTALPGTPAALRVVISPRLPQEALAAALPGLLSALFALMSRGPGGGGNGGSGGSGGGSGAQENEYLMRATMRLVAAGKERVAPLASQVGIRNRGREGRRACSQRCRLCVGSPSLFSRRPSHRGPRGHSRAPHDLGHSLLPLQLTGALTSILGRVCANPSNPLFNHCLFETIAALMRYTVGAQPAAVGEFEALLFPPFQVRRPV